MSYSNGFLNYVQQSWTKMEEMTSSSATVRAAFTALLTPAAIAVVLHPVEQYKRDLQTGRPFMLGRGVIIAYVVQNLHRTMAASYFKNAAISTRKPLEEIIESGQAEHLHCYSSRLFAKLSAASLVAALDTGLTSYAKVTTLLQRYRQDIQLPTPSQKISATGIGLFARGVCNGLNAAGCIVVAPAVACWLNQHTSYSQQKIEVISMLSVGAMFGALFTWPDRVGAEQVTGLQRNPLNKFPHFHSYSFWRTTQLIVENKGMPELYHCWQLNAVRGFGAYGAMVGVKWLIDSFANYLSHQPVLPLENIKLRNRLADEAINLMSCLLG